MNPASYLAPTFPKLLLTVILFVLISQLAAAVGTPAYDPTQPASNPFRSPVIESSPDDDRYFFTLHPLFWLPSYLVFFNSSQTHLLETMLPFSYPYWVLLAYFFSCLVFWLPTRLKIPPPEVKFSRHPDHFSG